MFTSRCWAAILTAFITAGSGAVIPAVARESVLHAAPINAEYFVGGAPVNKSPNVTQKKGSQNLVEKYLINGRLSEGESFLTSHLLHYKGDDQARFGLGMLQFLQAVQKFGQALYLHGLRGPDSVGLRSSLLDLPLAQNPLPQPINYDQWRSIVTDFVADLERAENTLSQITDRDVQLPLHFGLIKLDLKGSNPQALTPLWQIYAALTSRTMVAQQAENFYIKFDRGDVHWLRGYCHVFSALAESYLAYDSRNTFERTAQIFFARVDTHYPFLSGGKHWRNLGESDLDCLDLVALVHLIDWPLVEPARLRSALTHLEAVIDQSRESWRWIMAETDDDHEWLPNPRQTGVIPGMKVTDEMVTSWAEIMDENEKILRGEKLLPFWRGAEDKGINLRRVFLQPTRFDLVLWAQGSAAGPYLEQGQCTTGDQWNRMRSAFGNNFPGFALWFN